MHNYTLDTLLYSTTGTLNVLCFSRKFKVWLEFPKSYWYNKVQLLDTILSNNVSEYSGKCSP